jgi:arabinan endo-1,5-alpha-L-arabinosidase
MRYRSRHLREASVVALGLFAFACLAAQKAGDAPQALELSGEFAGTHDPSIGVDHGVYYVFATGAAYPPRPAGTSPETPTAAGGQPRPTAIGQFPLRCSPDLHQWTRCGHVFNAVPAWIQEMSPKTRDLWAPDISFFDGLYHLYYSFSVFGKNTSGIALATNETLDSTSTGSKWVDRGLVLRSTEQDDFNAIDPNLILDEKGEAWLAFGSFWTGIKMRHLDRKTGLLSTKDTRLYSLAARTKTATTGAPRNPDLPPDSEAIEAPFILRHGGFYYLFVSWDLCCRGLKSTYRTMVGRSKNVTGPYADRDGKPMLEGGGSAVLSANGKWLGPGGESLLHLADKDIIVFHAYSAVNGRPALHISTVGWKDGWPSASLEGDGR